MISARTADIARRAERLYAERLQQELEPDHANEYVAIEPESGQYFLGSTLSEAIQAANAAFPDRLTFTMRVGHAAAVHLGVLAT
jgi:hypothetical protein